MILINIYIYVLYFCLIYRRKSKDNFRILEAIVFTITIKSGLIATLLNFKTLKTIAELYTTPDEVAGVKIESNITHFRRTNRVSFSCDLFLLKILRRSRFSIVSSKTKEKSCGDRVK